MGINIQGKSGKTYTFEGGYTNTGSLQDRSGVYAIVDKLNNSLSLLDVGESSEVKTRIENHDREGCWAGKRKGQLQVAVLYTPNLQQQGRMNIEQDIRQNYSNLCGVR